MFNIGPIPLNETCLLSHASTPLVIQAFKNGLRADRLVKKSLVDLDEVDEPNAELTFKISYLHLKDRAAVIKLVKDQNLIKIYLESSVLRGGTSGIGYEFLVYPNKSILTAQNEQIEEQVHTQLFLFAFILLQLTNNFKFEVTRDNKKLDTESPAVAIYEALMDTNLQSTVICFNEPGVFENTEVKINISKVNGTIQISGNGVLVSQITLTQILANMSPLPLQVIYEGR